MWLKIKIPYVIKVHNECDIALFLKKNKLLRPNQDIDISLVFCLDKRSKMNKICVGYVWARGVEVAMPVVIINHDASLRHMLHSGRCTRTEGINYTSTHTYPFSLFFKDVPPPHKNTHTHTQCDLWVCVWAGPCIKLIFNGYWIKQKSLSETQP